MDRHTASLAPCQALARTLGWITSVATMVVLGFIANRWPGRFGSIAGGMVGVGIAILNDSWQMMSATNHAMSFPALAPARTILHDMVSMAICLGGLVLVVFTGVGTGTTDGYELQQAVDYPQYGETFTLRRLMNAAHWFLMAVILWRFLFAVWGCYDCVQIATPEEQRRRHRRQMEEAQMYDA